MNKPPEERLLTDEEIKEDFKKYDVVDVDLPEDVLPEMNRLHGSIISMVRKAQDAKTFRETLKMVGELVTRIQAGHPEPTAGADHPYEPTYLMIDAKDWKALNQLAERQEGE